MVPSHQRVPVFALVLLWLLWLSVSLTQQGNIMPQRKHGDIQSNIRLNSMAIGITVAVQTEEVVELQVAEFADGDVRLTNGKIPSQGRVEVFYKGIWGTICDSGWGINEANVVCRQLGYQQAIKSEKRSKFGPGNNMDILLDRVYCHGDELQLADCEHGRWRDHHCSHKEEAGVVCDLTMEPLALSVGKISGIVIFCVTCIAYICLACAKNTRRRSTPRARRSNLSRDYASTSSAANRPRTCHSHSTQTRTSDPVHDAMLAARTHLPEQSMVTIEGGLPSYDEHMADLPPPYEAIVAAEDNGSTAVDATVESRGSGRSSEDQNVAGEAPKYEPPSYAL